MSAEGSRRASGRAGVREVAALAGVSTQTVSRVINDRPSIRRETRQRVLDAMDALGYRVNNAARALGTHRTRTLGVIASDAALYGPSAGIAALEAAARAAGLWITTAYADAADAASVSDAARHLRAQGVDGIVAVAAHARTLDVLARVADDVPVAALHAGAAAVVQREGAALAVRHLVALGHRRIARVAGPARWLEAAERDAGVALELTAHDLAGGPRWEGDWSAAAGAGLAASVARALAAPGGATAVVVANDQMALGLMAGLRARGIAVPGEVSVTGFDDNPDAAFYRPALTTVRIDVAADARRAVAEILGSPVPSAPPAPVLVPRESTAPPA